MSNKSPQYDLYYNPFSICSLQVLYTLRLRGNPKSAADAVDPKENFIDIYTGEQWSEKYLEIHPRGTVPALVAPSINVRLIDSADITTYLMSHYPTLCPAAHKDTIEPLLDELHAISYVTLTFKPEERRIEGVMDAVQETMNQPDTSEKYRKLLQVKLEGHAALLQHQAKNSVTVASARAASAAYFEKILQILRSHSGTSDTWLFGPSAAPTALDAQTIVFIARLLDAGHGDLIPKEVLEYAKPKLEGEAWLGITQGRPTMHTLWEKMQHENGEGK